MKDSFSLVLPTALALSVVVGCSQTNNKSAVAPEPEALGTLTAADIDREPALSIEQLLVARVPGLILRRARDGRTAIFVRGQNAEPLYVVNGAPLGNPASFSAISRFDIASIEVLKGPAGMAMWGMRGANGVIVVRTKSSRT